jgi:hypothetical protein
MNKDSAKKFIDIGREGSVLVDKSNKPVMQFARAGEEDVKWIEGLSDKQLLETWAGYVQMIEVIECYSVMDCQMESLLEFEIHTRHLDEKAEEIYNEVVKDKDKDYEM